jgi:predicted MFS family arabinose efflux permease
VGGDKVSGWLRSYKSALLVRDLRLLFAGLLVSSTGSWAYNVGLLALVYDRTHSLAWIGLAGLARFAPSLLASPYGGVIAERTERIRLMVTADILSTVWQVGLVVVAATRAPILVALAFSALTAVTNVVYSPAVAATIPSIVKETDLVAANALNGTIDNLVIILGPAVGALLLVLGSPTTAFVANAASFAISAVVVSRVRTRSRPVDVTEAGTAGPLRQMTVGVRSIMRHNSARVLVALSALASFVYGTDTVLFVAVSQRRLGTGAEGFGYLLAGLGIGGVLMAAGVDRLSRSSHLAPILLAGMALYALPTSILMFTHSAALAFAIQIVRGAATLVVDVLAITSLQRSVPPDELARVFGIFFAFVLGAICLGVVITPALINAFGLDDGLFTMALGPFALALVGFLSLRRVDLANSARSEALAPRVAILEELQLFAAASQLVLERLASVETDVDFAAGTAIVTEGDPADYIYVLVEGEVDVRAHVSDGPDRYICTLAAPAYFGEIGVLEHIPRTATVSAITSCLCARISGAELLESLEVAGASSSLLSGARSRLGATAAARRSGSDAIDLSETAPPAPDDRPIVPAREPLSG